MEFIVSSAELLKGVLNVSKAIPAKTSLPILENFLFVLAENRLDITASDQELTLRTSVPVEVKEAGSMAVPVVTSRAKTRAVAVRTLKYRGIIM